MDQELKSKWLEALRSGRYQQAKGVLKNEEGFCCLGVLCDVVDSSAWIPGENQSCWKTKDIYGNLPADLAEMLDVREHCEYLPTLNDRGVSFTEIANLIEKDDIIGGFERITGRSANE